MKYLLNCTNPETTLSSLSNIFRTTNQKLLNELMLIERIPELEHVPEYVYNEISSKFIVPDEINAIWFHGTRTRDSESFRLKGILPKSAVQDQIFEDLKFLAQGIKKQGGATPFSMSFSAKQCKEHEGPFAALFKELIVSPRGDFGSYAKAPELVEDIAGMLLGENHQELINKYQSLTKPYAISFIDKADFYQVRSALWYLHLVLQGEDSDEAAAIAVDCFNSHGKPILPDAIQAIEELRM